VKALVAGISVVVCLAVAGWGGWEWYRQRETAKVAPAVPATVIKRGDVRFLVTARGELHGGNSEMLVAPMSGGRELVLTSLRLSGELVEPGDTVAQFDTTELEFELREAEADLLEAEQQLNQAKAEADAKEEETQYALVQAEYQLKLAEIEVKKNPLIEAIRAKQNTLALEAARDHLAKLQQDVKNRGETSRAGIAIQEAGVMKAKMKAEMSRKFLDGATLKAKSKGYVSVQTNMNTNIMFSGMQLPLLQTGDTVRAGMAVAQIPDMASWEATARIGELDRGHLAEGQPAEIEVVALPGKKFAGRIKSIGGTTGPPWQRVFECKLAVDQPSPELRPGMTVNIVITTGEMKNVLWAPSQALFESDGRTFVYLDTPTGYQPRDVKLVRRSESQVVLEGLKEGARVALASPAAQDTKKGAPGKGSGVMKAIPKT
jgi:HlyD family secretion protein